MPEDSAYLAGLIDTEGSIVFNYPENRIEAHIELKQNEYSENLDISKVIPKSNLKVYKNKKRNQNREKIFYSIRMSYASTDNMLPLYEYALRNRLYSDFKFFRIMQIKPFLKIRQYKNSKEKEELIIYKNQLRKFITYLNEHKKLPEYCE